MKYVVKIVRRDEEGKLNSLFTEGRALVQYQQGVAVKAPRWLARRGYHLTVFASLEDAVNFRPIFDESLGIELWWAEAEDVTEVKLPFLNMNSLKYGKITPMDCEWPWGTLLAESVKLVRKVTRDEFERAIEQVFFRHLYSK